MMPLLRVTHFGPCRRYHSAIQEGRNGWQRCEIAVDGAMVCNDCTSLAAA